MFLKTVNHRMKQFADTDEVKANREKNAAS